MNVSGTGGQAGTAGTGSVSQPNAARPGQVAEQFGHLSGVVEMLESTVTSLGKRLEAVLNPELRTEEGGQGRPPCTTPLAEDLALCAERVNNVVRRLISIIGRVEL
jgi:hypothetical protein